MLPSHSRLCEPGRQTHRFADPKVLFNGHNTKKHDLHNTVIGPLQEQLWSALKTGQIDMVVSDHSPCTPDLKKLESGDFTQAWGGISSLQFGTFLKLSGVLPECFTLHSFIRPHIHRLMVASYWVGTTDCRTNSFYQNLCNYFTLNSSHIQILHSFYIHGE